MSWRIGEFGAQAWIQLDLDFVVSQLEDDYGFVPMMSYSPAPSACGDNPFIPPDTTDHLFRPSNVHMAFPVH